MLNRTRSDARREPPRFRRRRKSSARSGQGSAVAKIRADLLLHHHHEVRCTDWLLLRSIGDAAAARLASAAFDLSGGCAASQNISICLARRVAQGGRRLVRAGRRRQRSPCHHGFVPVRTKPCCRKAPGRRRLPVDQHHQERSMTGLAGSLALISWTLMCSRSRRFRPPSGGAHGRDQAGRLPG